MADSDEDLVEETVLLDRAIWRKWNKFTWSGLILILVGLLLIGWGLALNLGPYSIAGILIGLGAIIIIVGIIRVLIGIINPLSPTDLRATEPPPPEADIL